MTRALFEAAAVFVPLTLVFAVLSVCADASSEVSPHQGGGAGPPASPATTPRPRKADR
jgi:hypothetical protein